MTQLKLQPREAKKSAESYRSEGKIPAVFYGSKTEPVSVALDAKDFVKIWKEAGESTVITLKTEAGDKSALIHDIQVHPVSGEPIHVDFYVVEKGQMVKVDVELDFVGESPAVKDKDGVLVKVLHELEIEADATNLPHKIDVDISKLVNIGDSIQIGDLALPSGVVATADPEEIVATVSQAQTEEEADLEAGGAVDMASVGVAGEEGSAEAAAESVDAGGEDSAE